MSKLDWKNTEKIPWKNTGAQRKPEHFLFTTDFEKSEPQISIYVFKQIKEMWIWFVLFFVAKHFWNSVFNPEVYRKSFYSAFDFFLETKHFFLWKKYLPCFDLKDYSARIECSWGGHFFNKKRVSQSSLQFFIQWSCSELLASNKKKWKKISLFLIVEL